MQKSLGFFGSSQGHSAGEQMRVCELASHGARQTSTDLPCACLQQLCCLQTAPGKFYQGNECPPVAENSEIDQFSWFSVTAMELVYIVQFQFVDVSTYSVAVQY